MNMKFTDPSMEASHERHQHKAAAWPSPYWKCPVTAERVGRYRENKKIRQAEHPQSSRAELLADLEAANNHVRQLDAQLALFVTDNYG